MSENLYYETIDKILENKKIEIDKIYALKYEKPVNKDTRIMQHRHFLSLINK